jgi:uncharacterized protein (DUF697 family)
MVLTPLQMLMVAVVAALSCRELSMATAAEYFGATAVHGGTAYALREAARQLAKFLLPGAGSVISAAVATAGTLAVGKAAVTYYFDTNPVRPEASHAGLKK